MKKVSKIGYVNFHGLNLKETLFLPTLKYNLLLVNKLSKTNSICCLFFFNFYLLQDLKSMRLLAVGRVIGDLYIVHQHPFSSNVIHQFSSFGTLLPSVFPKNINFACTGSDQLNKDCDTLWHVRLGHLNDFTLQHLPFFNNNASCSKGYQIVLCLNK